MKATQAIVTLTVGERYKALWQDRCRANWAHYASRHGYDLISLDRPLDDSERARHRSPAWQKCLILDQPFAARYERIVWIDADMLINPAAPAITAEVPPEQVGAVDEFATPTPELHAQIVRKLYRLWELRGMRFVHNETARDYYAAYGLPPRFDAVVQTGVMVLSPRHHRELMLSVYHDYEDKGPRWNYEMRPLSFELLSAGVVSWLDPRFNYIWGSYKALHYPFLLNDPGHPRVASAITAAMRDVYCLHFAGATEDIPGDRDAPAAAGRSAPRARRRSATADTDWCASTPVVLFIYARADTTRRVLDAIRAVRPQQLLVVANAAPGDDSGAAAAVQAARAVIDEVDWDCEVVRKFSDPHQGLKAQIESGLDWAFSQVEEAIVLEDDCVPHPSFFRFCEELLARYRDDPRVMAICGDSFTSDPSAQPDRYRYSRYPLIWGWATWRRAWRCYDPDMTDWPQLRDQGWLKDLLDDPHAVAYWAHLFENTYRGNESWDYAWTMTCWRHGGLSVLPEVNLVSNIGFRDDATHTRDSESAFAELPTTAAGFPLRHPTSIERDVEGDRFLEDVLFSGNLVRLFQLLRAGRRLVRARAEP